MGILGPLSRRVGPRGRVVGLDIDPQLLAAAQEYVHEQGLTNVELVQGDARSTHLPHAAFDFVHARFMLVFGHADEIVHEMIELARPAGSIAVEETDQSSWNFYPPRPVWTRLKQALEAAFLRIGGDANLGQRTCEMLRHAGLEDVQIRAATMALQNSHPYMRMPIIGANGFRKVIVGASLMTEAELDATLAEMEQVIHDPVTYAVWFTVTQVWGRKPT